MFVEFVSKKNEKLCINVSQILLVTDYKGNAIIYDISGCDYLLSDSYETVVSKLLNLN